jgi:hypothetical protein
MQSLKKPSEAMKSEFLLQSLAFLRASISYIEKGFGFLFDGYRNRAKCPCGNMSVVRILVFKDLSVRRENLCIIPYNEPLSKTHH